MCSALRAGDSNGYPRRSANMTLGLTSSGAIKIKTDAGLRAVECACCETFQLEITYDWSGTDMYDLDSSTQAFGETVGFDCQNIEVYVKWIGGDNTGLNGSERVDVLVNTARTDGLWSSSYNIQCNAGWYEPEGGSGPANLIVKYKSKTKNKSISPGQSNNCADTAVATITVYSTAQPDGSFFEIV